MTDTGDLDDLSALKIISKEYSQLLSELTQRVTLWSYRGVLSLNEELVLLYHHVGIHILGAQAKYDWEPKVIEQLLRELGKQFPELKGFSIRNLKHMANFSKNILMLYLCRRCLHN